MSMSNNSTFLTVRRQTSPPFHVEACLPFTNREMDYSAVAIWSKRKTSNGDIGSTLHLQLLEVVRKQQNRKFTIVLNEKVKKVHLFNNTHDN